MKLHLKMMAGLPGCGKTRWVATDAFAPREDGFLPSEHIKAFVLSTDDIIETVAKQYGLTYNDCFKSLIDFADTAMYAKLNRALEYARTTERDIVIYWDQTNLSKKSRQRKLSKFLNAVAYNLLLEKADITKTLIHVACSVETCVKRQSLRSHQVSEATINDMAQRAEPGSKAEGWDEIIMVDGHTGLTCESSPQFASAS